MQLAFKQAEPQQVRILKFPSPRNDELFHIVSRFLILNGVTLSIDTFLRALSIDTYTGKKIRAKRHERLAETTD